jgi:hypothetical protein
MALWNYELCVKVVNKSNLQSKTPSVVTHRRDNIYISFLLLFGVSGIEVSDNGQGILTGVYSGFLRYLWANLCDSCWK